ncbi:hypothetical protein FA15DRAFT_655535 [Coprinopsis marcescibilis]|uniref:Uncharacterized protein n=1 Tax=Coprinopsis marcescibilis TaxID=230819 RepID=A0A5C3KW39_COPMA|nr:hypothetical protein FA15DRAFT_655535 [Coprinopsis marcescibilis]
MRGFLIPRAFAKGIRPSRLVPSLGQAGPRRAVSLFGERGLPKKIARRRVRVPSPPSDVLFALNLLLGRAKLETMEVDGECSGAKCIVLAVLSPSASFRRRSRKLPGMGTYFDAVDGFASEDPKTSKSQSPATPAGLAAPVLLVWASEQAEVQGTVKSSLVVLIFDSDLSALAYSIKMRSVINAASSAGDPRFLGIA